MFVGFTPAISKKAAKNISTKIKKWRLGLRNSQSIEELAKDINPVIRGWINYYGKFNRSELMKVLKLIDFHLLKWVNQKYKRRGKYSIKSKSKLGRICQYDRSLFAHWKVGVCFKTE